MQIKTQKKYLLLSMQGLNVIFSLSDVLIKLASRGWEAAGFFSSNTLIFLFCGILLLGIYAIFWQIILKKTTLSVAYLNKATVLFWGMLWAVIIFNEKISFFNIVGTIIIFIGI